MIRVTISLVLTLFLIILVSKSFAQSPITVKTETNSQLKEQVNLGDNCGDNPKKENNVPISAINSSKAISIESKADTNIIQSQPASQSPTTDKQQSQEKDRPDPSTAKQKQENIASPNVIKKNAAITEKAINEEKTNNKKQPNGFISASSKTAKKAIGGNSDLPAILMGLVVAYLTILISVAIAIFSEKKEFETLDRNVILDHIIKAKRLLIYLGLTFIPLILWNGTLLYIRILWIVLWIIGVICMTSILINSYHWMKGNKFQLRFGYLEELQSRQDMEEAWRSVWKTENINHQNELKFFDIFYSAIERLLKNDENDIVVTIKLLGDFNNFLKRRSTGFLTWSEKILGSFLNWHFEMWKKEHEYLHQDKNIEKWSAYSQLSRTTDLIFQQTIILTLKERRTYSFFRTLKAHARKYEKAIVSGPSYSEFLFSTFYKEFFENIYDAPERYDIWEHYFPAEWKITKNNLQSSDNQISQITLTKFLEWAGPKIWEVREEKDFVLDDVSRNIFPEVDPILWASILIFIFSPYGDDRMRSVVESQWNFGFFGRVKVSFDSQKEDLAESFKDDVLNTLDLSIFLFTEQFSKENLMTYLQSLKELSYPKESKEERKRLRLCKLFGKMLDFLMSSETSNS